MRYQFTGTVKVFNGRYWKAHDIRTKATKLQHAAKEAIEHTLKTHYKGKRITAVSVTIERLGPILESPSVALDLGAGALVDDEHLDVVTS